MVDVTNVLGLTKFGLWFCCFKLSAIGIYTLYCAMPTCVNAIYYVIQPVWTISRVLHSRYGGFAWTLCCAFESGRKKLW